LELKPDGNGKGIHAQRDGQYDHFKHAGAFQFTRSELTPIERGAQKCSIVSRQPDRCADRLDILIMLE